VTSLDAVWTHFVDLLGKHSPGAATRIRPRAAPEVIAAAEARLGRALPGDLRALYARCDGFEAGAFLLRDDYRVLPVEEMVAESLALVGEPVVLDALAGQVTIPKKVVRLVFAPARPDDVDVVQCSIRLRAKRPTVEVWFREGGIHGDEEVVDTNLSLAEWIEECLEYYG
jgi:hypothetical protein